MLKEVVWLVVIANLIAWPLAFYAAGRWLDDFVYRVDLGIGLFALAGTVTLLITVLTTAHQALRAANVSPARALRYE